MESMTLEQQYAIIDNFVRKCCECGMQLQPVSTMCVMCRARTPMPKIFDGSYLEHFEMKRCDIAKDTTFWYCVHPTATCELEDLLTFCVHCITVELLKADLVTVKDGKMQWKTEQHDLEDK